MGSSDSLSFPSEPPDLGNWFSSYGYESPALSSADDFKDSGCSVLAEIGDSKKERTEDFHEIGAATKGEALLTDEKATSNGFLTSKCLAGRDNLASEVFENADFLSHFSEPPDVKNWFSSYVYESPALDTSCEFGSQPIEDGIDEGENHAPNSSTQKKEESINITKAVELHDLKVQIISSNEPIKCIHSLREKGLHQHHSAKDSEKASRNKNLAMLNAPTPEWLLHRIMDEEKMQDRGCGLAKDFEMSIISKGSSPGNFDAQFDKEASHLLDVTNVSESRKQTLARKSLQSNDPAEESFKNEAFAEGMDLISPAEKLNLNNVVNKRPLNNAAGGHANKENVRNEYSENGFISTRKSSQAEGENSFRKPIKHEIKLPPKGNKEGIATRKVLLETTNFEVPDGLEITGKWRCPQKSKPNLGPPLKQLRLEQWVRRV